METAAVTYLVMARRYRPQNFEDLVGQEAIAQTLRNAIETDRVGHAFLFSGPRGVGKTTLARILAKALNCETGVTPTPCGKCTSCRAVAEGRDLDVIEIDGASNNGVENIRDIRESSETVALRSRHKIYIIDEVHMLSKGAFNALLKTLEEPPLHVKFIFATTEPQKVPDTIHSRCQRYTLREIRPADIVKRLEQICTAEEIKAEDGVLDLIAQNVQGGMRDALSALDQVRSYCGNTIDTASAVTVLGIAGHKALFAVTQAVAQGTAAEALAALEAALAASRSPEELVGQWIDFLREAMIGISCGEGAAPFRRTGTATDEQVAQLKERLSPEFLVYAIQLLVETRTRMLRSLQGSVLLEIALIKLCRMDTFRPLEQIAALAETRGSPPPPRRTVAPSAPVGPPEPSNRPMTAEPAPSYESSGPKPPAAPVMTGDQAGFWDALHDAVEESAGPMAASCLREGRLLEVTDSEVVAQIDVAFYRSTLTERETRQKIEEAIGKLLGGPRTFRVEAGPGTVAPKPAPAAPAAPAAATAQPARKKSEPPKPAGKAKRSKTDKPGPARSGEMDDAVADALRLFKGRVTAVQAAPQRDKEPEA